MRQVNRFHIDPEPTPQPWPPKSITVELRERREACEQLAKLQRYEQQRQRYLQLTDPRLGESHGPPFRAPRYSGDLIEGQCYVESANFSSGIGDRLTGEVVVSSGGVRYKLVSTDREAMQRVSQLAHQLDEAPTAELRSLLNSDAFRCVMISDEALDGPRQEFYG